MYDFLVLPEFNESELDLGYDNSNVANAFPEQLSVNTGFPATATAAPVASSAPATVNPVDTDFYPSDPYYTYESNALAIDDVVFPSMLSPSGSSAGTSPTLPSSDSLFESYDVDKSPDLDLDSLMSMPLCQPIHMSPVQTSPVQTSPIACQPTPVHSRSQSYSLPFEGSHINNNNIPNIHNNNTIHTHTHNHTQSPESSVCESDEEEEELSLDDSPSAHGVLFKNLSHDEQTKYRKYHCPVCKKYFRRDLPRHLRIHQRVARFVCPYPRDQCSHKRGQFNRPYDYKKHLLHSHFQFDEAKLVRGFRDLKSKLSHYGTCNCGRRFRADKWLDDHVMKCLKEMN
ncbi:hypothetical protein CJU89_2540 [Yarrowia sp. B02]|nr:hypothetical protein CJU89_2540 [Yarrowia sp. B02]